MRRCPTLLALLFICASIPAATIHVPGDYETIQEGIDAASDGDTVMVGPGTYVGSITFHAAPDPRVIKLISSGGPDSTTIQGDEPAVVTFAPYCSGGELTGFTVRGPGPVGIWFSYDGEPAIRECDIGYFARGIEGGYAPPEIALRLQPTTRAAIVQNTIHHNDEGISTHDNYWLRVDSNLFEHNVVAIDCGDYDDIYIRHDTIRLNEIAIRVGYDNRSAIIGNEIYSNGAGIADGQFDSGQIIGNLIYDNTGAAIAVDCRNCDISNNTLVNNGAGVRLENYDYGGTGTTISRNIIVNSDGAGAVALSASFECNNIWNNGSGNAVGLDGVSRNPLFCNPLAGDYSIADVSPCAPDHNGCQVLIGALDTSCVYICGDLDGDGEVTWDDLTFLWDFYFMYGEQHVPYIAGDMDQNGLIDIGDIVWLSQYLAGYATPPCYGGTYRPWGRDLIRE